MLLYLLIRFSLCFGLSLGPSISKSFRDAPPTHTHKPSQTGGCTPELLFFFKLGPQCLIPAASHPAANSPQCVLRVKKPTQPCHLQKPGCDMGLHTEQTPRCSCTLRSYVDVPSMTVHVGQFWLRPTSTGIMYNLMQRSFTWLTLQFYRGRRVLKSTPQQCPTLDTWGGLIVGFLQLYKTHSEYSRYHITIPT